MAGNHYLDAGPCYEAPNRESRAGAAAHYRAEANRNAFKVLAKRHAAEIVALAKKLGVDPSANALKFAQKRNRTHVDDVADDLASLILDNFDLPDPDDAREAAAEDARLGPW